MILLDTMVVSELRKARPSSRVMTWAGRYREEDFFVSALTLGEIEQAIARARDAVFRADLERWLDGLSRQFGERMLDVTAPVARQWGRWAGLLGHAGIDLLIAATAHVHGLTVATRDTRRFESTGVATVDPFA